MIRAWRAQRRVDQMIGPRHEIEHIRAGQAFAQLGPGRTQQRTQQGGRQRQQGRIVTPLRRRRQAGIDGVDGTADECDAGVITVTRGLSPAEQTVAFENEATPLRMGAYQFADAQAEIETWALPANPADFVTIYPLGYGLRLMGGRNGDDGIGVQVIDMTVGNEGMQRRIDTGGARIEPEGAVRQQPHHVVFGITALIKLFQTLHAIEIERGEAVALHRAEVTAGTFHPQHRHRRAGQRIEILQFRRGITPAEIGHRQVGTEQIGTIKQAVGLAQIPGDGIVPQVPRAKQLDGGPDRRRPQLALHGGNAGFAIVCDRSILRQAH